MQIDILSYVVLNLRKSKGKHRDIAKATGVPYSTVSKIHQGITPNPGVQTVQALADYFASLNTSIDPGKNK